MDRKAEIEKAVIEQLKKTEASQRQLLDEFFEGKRSAEYTVLTMAVGIRMALASIMMIHTQPPKFKSGGITLNNDDNPEAIKIKET